ncbi:MAG TPA: hypothetical protein DCY13_09870 [Verrucomicrobiales bacterium]|nr:hypothetical protein [Verrucomicrobiales bacterium]
MPAAVPIDGGGGRIGDLAATNASPWGTLELTPIYLERPDHLLESIDEYFGHRPWVFANAGIPELQRFFAAVDLTNDQRRWLADDSNWLVENGLISLLPPHDLVLQLSPEARRRIYLHLSAIPGNLFKNDPFLVPAARERHWFTDSGLSDETVQLVRSLMYPRGELLLFSDLAAVGSRIPVEERPRLVRTLSRVEAVQARLLITADSDLDAIGRYWGTGAGARTARAVLSALKRRPEGGRLDISYLLPPFARERLYTFPDPETDELAGLKDCFWTAMNFQSRLPDRRMLDPDFRIARLQENYDLVQDDPQLGDILVIKDAGGTAIHACVYIASGVVFTKNGASQFSPWVLMTFADMASYYDVGNPPRLTIHRQRKPPES